MLYEGPQEKFFLLMVQPPERVRPQQVPTREYIFIVDVSGSMNGFPLDVAKILMSELIGSLRNTDTFNLVLFAGSSSVMFPSSVPATTENITKAKDFLSRERGGGGTEMLSAIKRAFACPKKENSSRSLVLISDGYINAEPESIPDLFASRPLVIFGKYQGEAKGMIKIEGVSGGGDYARSFELSEFNSNVR